MERKQPNCVAALLAVIGCEAPGRLCGHVQEGWIFVECDRGAERRGAREQRNIIACTPDHLARRS
jgi:hypothetical protein